MAIFNFIVSISTFVIIAFICFLPLHFYRTLYPKCITCLRIRRGVAPMACAVKPNKAFFRNISLNRNSSFVSIGNGYFAYYCVSDPNSDFVNFEQISFSDEIFIFSRSRLGRFRSIDVSDRCLFDSIKKFIDSN